LELFPGEDFSWPRGQIFVKDMGVGRMILNHKFWGVLMLNQVVKNQIGRIQNIKTMCFLVALFAAFALASCTRNKSELGTAENPIKLHFVPSVDAKVIESNSKTFKTYLEANTPYKFEISVPQSYVAVIEAFGTKRADVAALNTFGYVLAHQKYGAEAKLVTVRHGSATYQSQFIVRADSKFNKLEDLQDARVAFVDAASASGYLLPLRTLKEKNIKTKETVFAGKHDGVVTMVYQGQVDAGATFYSPPSEGKIEDARRLVLTQFPDVEKKVRILDLSLPIPNDPLVFRKEMPEEMKRKLIDALLKFVTTPEGKAAFKEVYGVTELKVTSDQDYEEARKMLTALGKTAEDLMKK
jgi:phosphonate transport system substrate-binding protein